VEIVFFPTWSFFNLYELSSWSRAMLIPLAILNQHRPTGNCRAILQLHELYSAARRRGIWGWAAKPRLSWQTFSSATGWLKVLSRLPRRKPFRAHALACAEQ